MEDYDSKYDNFIKGTQFEIKEKGDTTNLQFREVKVPNQCMNGHRMKMVSQLDGGSKKCPVEECGKSLPPCLWCQECQREICPACYDQGSVNGISGKQEVKIKIQDILMKRYRDEIGADFDLIESFNRSGPIEHFQVDNQTGFIFFTLGKCIFALKSENAFNFMTENIDYEK